MSSSAEQTFDEITGELDYPMLIVTASGEDGPAGCLVGFATQGSIDPPRHFVCISDKNETFQVAATAAVLAVHFLDADAARLAHLFGEQSSDTVDKFAACAWHPGPRGVPILDDCGRWIVGKVLMRHRLGDHVGFLLEPIAAHNEGSFAPLSYQRVKDLKPGHDA